MSKKGDKHYTKKEVEFLIENFDEMTYQELAKHLAKSYQSISNKCWRLGIAHKGRRIGELNGNWKGGYSYTNGYIKDNKIDRLQHSLVMEQIVGRPLVKGEIIHHIDGNKANNDPTNLVLTNMKDHRYMHGSLEKLGYILTQAGYIEFDRVTNTYNFSSDLYDILAGSGSFNL